MSDLSEKLESVEVRFVELEESLSQPTLSSQELTRITKERAELVEVVETWRRLKEAREELAASVDLAQNSDDADMRALAEEEISELRPVCEKLTDELTILMLPKDPNDGKNAVLEIRAGTGGDEAALFCGDLLRMYVKYSDTCGWKTDVLSSTPSSAGGFKEVVVLVEGHNVFSRLKFEMGVHRVQRVPATESQGRIHTSACTVAVLPEAEEVEVDINPSDLEIKVCRASGAGGQHVNTTDSAVRVLHKPSGLVVECQDERSQHKNKDKALKVLRSRLYDKMQAEKDAEMSADRKSQVGSGDRSERIRTYNFPQGRLTDHRINLTLYKLDGVMEGEIGEILDALGTHHTAELLKSQQQ